MLRSFSRHCVVSSRVVDNDALRGYHALTYWSPRSGPGPPGWLLETSDGRRFKLEPINLHDLPLVEGALTSLSLQCGSP